ncbi:MAG: cytochrome c oxidase accessory protein CcoG, partial [Pseudomonadota bacterium]
AQIKGPTRYALEGSEDRDVNIRVSADADALAVPSTELRFEIVAEDMPALRAARESRFMKPL